MGDRALFLGASETFSLARHILGSLKISLIARGRNVSKFKKVVDLDMADCSEISSYVNSRAQSLILLCLNLLYLGVQPISSCTDFVRELLADL